MTENGLTTIVSARGVKDTIDRLESEVKSKGMTVFARIDHASGAKKAGLPLRPTELLIFGDARGGTPLMQAAQTIGIDLPLKALAWEDAEGKVWLSYNEPAWIADRHGASGQICRSRAAARRGACRTVEIRPRSMNDHATGVTLTETPMRWPPEPRMTPSTGATSV
jgi:uncharacterized protein (DUF302 family)